MGFGGGLLLLPPLYKKKILYKTLSGSRDQFFLMIDALSHTFCLTIMCLGQYPESKPVESFLYFVSEFSGDTSWTHEA